MKTSAFVLSVVTIFSLRAFADANCSVSRHGNLPVKNLFTVVNKEPGRQLSPRYVPLDLQVVPVELLSPIAPKHQMLRAETLAAYSRMQAEALKAGVKLFIRSSYRSFDDQCRTFASKVDKFTAQFHSDEKGLKYARQISAEPGRSQHQLGTTMDIVFEELNYDFSIEKADQTPSFHWLDQHAHEFGFIMSYPYGDDDPENHGYNSATGYFFEPWHWRYVGVETARAFKVSGQLPDAFLKTLEKN